MGGGGGRGGIKKEKEREKRENIACMCDRMYRSSTRSGPLPKKGWLTGKLSRTDEMKDQQMNELIGIRTEELITMMDGRTAGLTSRRIHTK